MPGELIPYREWMKDTAVPGRVRSGELKTLDEALRMFSVMASDANFLAVQRAYDTWANKKGTGGVQPKSVRNAKGAVDKIEGQLYPRSPTKYRDDMAHSRKGLLYLFAKTEVEMGAMGFAKLLLEGGSSLVDVGKDLPGSRITEQGAAIAGKAVTVTIKSLETAPALVSALRHPKSETDLPTIEPKMNGLHANRTPNEVGSTLLQRFTDFFKDFALKVWEAIKARASDFWRQSKWEKAVDVWGLVSKVAKVIVERLAAQAAPFVGGAVDIVNGVRDTVTACYERWKSYSLGKEVELNRGHPGVVAASIERAMNLGIGKGLYDTLKGAASVTAAAFSGGASAIASFVVAGCEILAKLVYRIWEIVGMRAFCASAEERYGKGEAGYADAADFKKWFYNAAYALPCISASAINSGITGDKMMYISMFSDETEKNVISGEKFSRGVEYLDNLKEWSRNYLSDSGYQFRSRDALVQALHARSISSKREVLTQISRDEGVALP